MKASSEHMYLIQQDFIQHTTSNTVPVLIFLFLLCILTH